MKRVNVGGLCLVSLCLMAACGCGAAGASAASLLFVPNSGKFPYHMVGTGGPAVIETVSGSVIEAASTDALALVLNATLIDLKLEFLKVKESSAFQSACKNDGKTEAILINLLGHLGFADPGIKPAVLDLVPSGFEFECDGGFAKMKLRGAIIGEIASPALNTVAESMRVVFKQTAGTQALQTFLMGGETLTGQHEESSLNGGAFEESGQSSEGSLTVLAGQGTFLLVSP